MDPFEMHRLGIVRRDPAAKFRRQVRLQLYLPLALGVLLLSGLAAVLWRGRIVETSVLADAALSFMLLVVMIFGLLALGVFSALAVGVWYAVRRLPEPFERARLAVSRAEHAAEQAVHKAALPLIVPKSIAHSLAFTLRYLAGIFRGGR